MTINHSIYLDHNATTPLKSLVRAAMLEAMDFTGNASSIHKQGREARRRIESARRQIMQFVNAGEKSVVVFTSGATEANNLVLRGSGCERVFVSAIEHPSVLKARTDSEIIPVLSNGLIDLEALDTMLAGNDRSVLLSVMLVNNETGVIQPVEQIVEIAKRRGALVHTDAVQAAGRLPIDIQKLGVDYLTLSAHKMGGGQGTGCLIMSNCVSVSPMIVGGNQEKNMRAGTENMAGIIGFAKACEIAGLQDFSSLRDHMEAALCAAAPTLNFFGKTAPRVGNTSMFALAGASSEMQMIALDLANIAVSNGSACSSGTVGKSYVLKAMGASADEINASLRISFGWNTTEQEVEIFIAEWVKIYHRIKSRLG
jgi:cysteine desulfurase